MHPDTSLPGHDVAPPPPRWDMISWDIRGTHLWGSPVFCLLRAQGQRYAIFILQVSSIVLRNLRLQSSWEKQECQVITKRWAVPAITDVPLVPIRTSFLFASMLLLTYQYLREKKNKPTEAKKDEDELLDLSLTRKQRPVRPKRTDNLERKLFFFCGNLSKAGQYASFIWSDSMRQQGGTERAGWHCAGSYTTALWPIVSVMMVMMMRRCLSSKKCLCRMERCSAGSLAGEPVREPAGDTGSRVSIPHACSHQSLNEMHSKRHGTYGREHVQSPGDWQPGPCTCPIQYGSVGVNPAVQSGCEGWDGAKGEEGVANPAVNLTFTLVTFLQLPQKWVSLHI